MLCGYAGLVHLAVAPTHLGASALAGVFLGAVGAAQCSFAAMAFRRETPGTRLVVAAIALNAAVVAVYVASRTTTLPVGAHHGGAEDLPEPVAPLDLAVTVAEVAAVVMLLALLPGRWQRAAVDLLFATGVALWCWRIVLVA